jgi:rhamnose utilization protein RhaD (predicted bifunctional aldolase and dehydrogenase)
MQGSNVTMPQNLWNDNEYRALPDLEGLVYRSNLLGRDRAVCIYGVTAPNWSD